MKHKELVAKVKEIKGKKIKQREIGEILNLKISTVGHRATRNSDYKTEEIKKICQRLDIPVDLIFGEAEKHKNVNKINIYLRLIETQIEEIKKLLEV